MYICICRAVTEKAIRNAVADGARDLPSLQRRLGVGTECGSCHCAAEQMIEEVLGKTVSPPPAIAGFARPSARL